MATSSQRNSFSYEGNFTLFALTIRNWWWQETTIKHASVTLSISTTRSQRTGVSLKASSRSFVPNWRVRGRTMSDFKKRTETRGWPLVTSKLNSKVLNTGASAILSTVLLLCVCHPVYCPSAVCLPSCLLSFCCVYVFLSAAKDLIY